MSIFNAIKQNEIQIVQTLAPKHWNDDFNGLTPLAFACQYNRSECIAILAPYGNINKAKANITPLSQMVWHNQLESTMLLLDLGATIRNELCTAVFNQNVDMVNILIKYGAYINSTDDLGRTPLHLAINHKNEILIKLLLQHGADVKVPHLFEMFIDNNEIAIFNLLFDCDYKFMRFNRIIAL